MERSKLIDLKRSILQIQKPYPSDDLIGTYQEFISVRDFLSCYQFNINVFESLVELTNSKWNAKSRISRLSLMQKIKQYYYVGVEANINHKKHRRERKLSESCSRNLFDLFKKSFEEAEYVSKNQIDDIRKIANYLIIDISLSPEEEMWLCENAPKSNYILNRLLRYPKKSPIISSWIRENYDSPLIIQRRAEVVSWLIDEEAGFEVQKETLLMDFTLMNKLDQEAIKTYQNEIEANILIERELSYYLQKVQYFVNVTGEMQTGRSDLTQPELKLCQRPYPIPVENSQSCFVNIPDFEKMEVEYKAKLSSHLVKTMLWAIAYSRVENVQKTELFKKYYSDKTYPTILKIAKQTENTEILKWILSQNN